MADIIQAVKTILEAEAEITALVSTRIHPDHLPQGTIMPAIALWVISENALDQLTGPLGMDQPVVRAECYSTTRLGANTLRLLVREHLAGYSGTAATLWIKGVAQERGHQARTDRVSAATDQYRYVSVQDFRITYDEPSIA